jgi:hypothetical protein
MGINPAEFEKWQAEKRAEGVARMSAGLRLDDAHVILMQGYTPRPQDAVAAEENRMCRLMGINPAEFELYKRDPAAWKAQVQRGNR